MFSAYLMMTALMMATMVLLVVFVMFAMFVEVFLLIEIIVVLLFVSIFFLVVKVVESLVDDEKLFKVKAIGHNHINSQNIPPYTFFL